MIGSLLLYVVDHISLVGMFGSLHGTATIDMSVFVLLGVAFFRKHKPILEYFYIYFKCY
jgi:hypothetical protein